MSIFVPVERVQRRSLELESCKIEFLGGDLVHTHFKENRVVNEQDVQEMFRTINDHNDGRKVYLMVTVGEGTTLTNEARSQASSTDSCRYIAADAIVVRDFGHHLAANAFVRHYKPGRPVGMFPDPSSALEWLKQQRQMLRDRNP